MGFSFFHQIDEVWFVKYIPSQRRRIEEFRKHTRIFNHYVSKKIEETKQSMNDEEETSNFISAYLKEVENSNGKLQDRYQSNIFMQNGEKICCHLSHDFAFTIFGLFED